MHIKMISSTDTSGLTEALEKGWKIIDKYTESQLQQEYINNSNGGCSYEYHPHTYTTFILGMEEGSIEDSLNEKIKELNGHLKRLNEDLYKKCEINKGFEKEHKKEVEDLKNELSTKKYEIDELKKYNKRLSDVYDVNEKMENDLGKIRNTLGALKFQELLDMKISDKR